VERTPIDAVRPRPVAQAQTSPLSSAQASNRFALSPLSPICFLSDVGCLLYRLAGPTILSSSWEDRCKFVKDYVANEVDLSVGPNRQTRTERQGTQQANSFNQGSERIQ